MIFQVTELSLVESVSQWIGGADVRACVRAYVCDGKIKTAPREITDLSLIKFANIFLRFDGPIA